MREIVINESDLYGMLAARAEYLGAFAGSLDAKRPLAWKTYGYRADLTFDDYFQAYKRSGAAKGAVHRLLDKCWQAWPRIKSPAKDEASEWEKKLGKLLEGINAWQKLRDLDRRNMVGRYGAVIYRMADGKKLFEPLVRAEKLVDLVPVYENQIRVEKWDEDPASERYGQPLMFEIETAPPGQRNNQARPRTWLKVHPSRVQVLAEGSVGGNFMDGVPLLEAGFNALVDLEKISGGGAEGFLKNSARTVVVKLDVNANTMIQVPKQGGGFEQKPVADVVEEQVRKLNRNQDASIAVAGGDASTLQTQVTDATKPFDVAANVFAASVQIPFTILFGQQTGRLASDEDQKDWVARCSSRQVNELTPMLKEFVTRMQAAGVIDAGDFEIEWPPLDAPDDMAKAELLLKLTTAMEQFFKAGGAEPLFDRDELRKVPDYEQKPADDEFREDEPPVDPSAPPAPGPAPARRPIRAANDEEEGLLRQFMAWWRRRAA